MINKKKSILIVLLALAVALVTVGFSFWIIVATPKSIGANKYSGNSADLPYVAYIMRGSARTDYRTVEEALSNAKKDDTVYIISGTNPVINSSCTVKSGVTLTLHYNPNEQTASYGVESGQAERNYSYRTKVMDKAEDMVGYTYSDLRSGATAYSSFNSFSDTIDANLKNQITIAERVTVTVESGATINIGAIVGKAGAGMAGQTSGYFTQILMDKNSKIISNGTIDCLGYIKEKTANNGSQIMLNSGSLYAPFVIYDYNAARSTIAVAMNRYHQIYPFNVFDMPNVQSKIVCNNTANIYGYADIYSNEMSLASLLDKFGSFLGGIAASMMGIPSDGIIPAQHNLITLKVVGKQDSIINSNGRVELKYNIDKTLYNNTTVGMYNTGSTVDINCYGGGSLGALELIIKVLNFDVKMSTASYFFPICWKYNINLFDGSYSIANRAKFLSGSTLKINKGAMLNTSGDMVFYPRSTRTESENTADNANVFFDPTPSNGYPYPARDMAKMIVNGEANINAGMGGYALTEEDGAILAINSNALSITEWEGNGFIETMSEPEGISDGALTSVAYPYFDNGLIQGALKGMGVADGKGGYFFASDGKTRVPNGGETEYITQNAKGNVNTKGNIENLGNKFYVSSNGAWTEEDGYTQVTLKYNANGGTLTSDSFGEYWVKSGTTSVIRFVATPDPVREHYDFAGWYCEDGVTPAIGSPLTDGKTVYAKWEEKEYDLKLVIKEKDGNIKTESAGMLKLSTLPKMLETRANDGEYKFDGWYTTNMYNDSTKIADNKITATNLSELVRGDEVYVYARYIKPVYVTLVYDGADQEKFEVGVGSAYSADDLIDHLNSKSVVAKVEARNNNVDLSTYFDGKWYSDNTLENEFTGVDAIPEEGLKIYAGIRNKLKVTVTITHGGEKEGNITGNKAYYQIDVMYNAVRIGGVDKKTDITSDDEKSFEYYVISGTEIKVTTNNETGKENATTTTITQNNQTITQTTYETKDTSCIAAGTLITLADGTQKAVEDLVESDVLLVYDHETGEYVESGIIFIERDGWKNYDIINLEFSDGTKTRLIYEHGLFDLTLNKYVYITEQNYSEFVGHEFAMISGSGYERVTLTSAYMTNEHTGCYSLVTVYHMNYFIDGLFSMPGGIDGLFNYFEYDENMTYDEEKMLADIEKYGLYTYEDFAEYIPYEVYEYMFPAKYFKVAVEKGMITWEEILALIERYLAGHEII